MNLNRNKLILDQILLHLDDILIDKVEVPIERANRSITSFQQNNRCEDNFKEILITAYTSIYFPENGEYSDLIKREIHKEVIWILDKYYRGNETDGFDGALYDATENQSEDLRFVLARFVEIIRSLEQKKYLFGVLNSMIDPSDWTLKYSIVQEILDRYGHLYPPELQNLSPNQLVGHLEDLILIVISSNQFTRSLLCSN